MRPFNLEKYKSGKGACTSNGVNVIDLHLYKFNDKNKCEIIVQLEGLDDLVSYDINGKYENRERPDLDLFMTPIKKEYWINVLRDGDGDIHFSDGYFCSEETAQFWGRHSGHERFIKSIKVYEEER